MTNFSRQRSNNSEPLGYRAQSNGVVAGCDLLMAPEFDCGIAGAYTHTHVRNLSETPSGSHGGGHINTGYGSIYGRYSNCGIFIDGSLIGGWNRYHTTRPIYLTSSAGTINRHAKATYQGSSWDCYLGAGGIFNLCALDIQLGGSFDWVYLHHHGFTESKAQSVNLVVEKTTAHLLRSMGSIQVSYPLGCWVPQLGLAVAYDRRFGHGRYTAHFVDEPGDMIVSGLNPSQVLVLPEAKLVFEECGFSASLIYDGEFGKRYFSNDFSANLGWDF